jgi:sulfatase maturation enzyme AslB (radical SAM superfamily)
LLTKKENPAEGQVLAKHLGEKCSFDKAMKGLKLLQKHSIEFNIMALVPRYRMIKKQNPIYSTLSTSKTCLISAPISFMDGH